MVLKKEEKMEIDKNKKYTKWMVIACIYAVLLLIQAEKIFFKINNECYKAFKYALKNSKVSIDEHDFTVKQDTGNRMVYYSVNVDKELPYNTIKDAFREYLKNNPDSYLNDSYKIALIFYGEKHRDYSIIVYGIRNYDMDGNLHDDLDVAFFDDDEDFYMRSFSHFTGDRSKGLKNLIISECGGYYKLDNYYALFSGVKTVDCRYVNNHGYNYYYTFYNENERNAFSKNGDNSMPYRKLFFEGKPLDIATFIEREWYFDYKINVRENNEYIPYYVFDLYGNDSPIAALREDPSPEEIVYEIDKSRVDSSEAGAYVYYNSNLYNYLEKNWYNRYSDGMKSNILYKNIETERKQNTGVTSGELTPSHVFILSKDEIDKTYEEHLGIDYRRRTMQVKDVCRVGIWIRGLLRSDKWKACKWVEEHGNKYVYVSLDKSGYVQPAFLVNRDCRLVVVEDESGKNIMVFECDVE